MWIFDSYFKGAWNSGAVKEVCPGQRRLSSLVLHGPERSSCPLELIEALESRYRIEECSFNTIFGSPSRAIESSPAEKWPRRSRSRPATRERPLPLLRQKLVQVLTRLPISSKHPGDGGVWRSIPPQGDLLHPGSQRSQSKG
jgi:hypothetical protein